MLIVKQHLGVLMGGVKVDAGVVAPMVLYTRRQATRKFAYVVISNLTVQ